MTTEECESCALLAKKTNLVYEDETLAVFHHTKPAAAGHLIILPKEHYPILEMVPENVVGNLFWIANTLSTKVFDTFGVQGTNILVQNGTAAGQVVPHMQVHMIPRNEGDGLNFEWVPRQLSEDEMGTVALKLQEEADKIGVVEKEKPPTMELDSHEVIEEDEDDYRVKQLKRIP